MLEIDEELQLTISYLSTELERVSNQITGESINDLMGVTRLELCDYIIEWSGLFNEAIEDQDVPYQDTLDAFALTLVKNVEEGLCREHFIIDLIKETT